MHKGCSFSLSLVILISSLVVLMKKKPNMKQKGSYKHCKIKQFSWEKNILAIICNTYISRCCYLINIFSISEEDILPFSMTICERWSALHQFILTYIHYSLFLSNSFSLQSHYENCSLSKDRSHCSDNTLCYVLLSPKAYDTPLSL